MKTSTPSPWRHFVPKCLLLFAFSLGLRLAAHAVPYYVSPSGSDSNDGLSVQSAFATLQHAHNQTNPGDIVYILNGTYTVSQGHVLLITRSGTASNPITYRAYQDHQPKLFAAKQSACWAVLRIQASHIIIDGLELMGDNANITLSEGEAIHDYYKANIGAGTVNWDYVATTNTNGIYIIGNKALHTGPRNVVVRNCFIHDFPGAGISAEVSDYITIEDNIVHSTAWYMIYAGSGISFFHPYNADGNTSSYRNVVRNNISYNNETKVMWADQNKYSDGNGIIIDDTKNTQIVNPGDSDEIKNRKNYTGKTLVVNNLTYGNGGSGINIFSSHNVDVINNSIYNNNRSPHLNYANLSVGSCNNVNAFNNIVYSGNSANRVNSNGNNVNVNYNYNIYYNGQVATTGSNDIVADPLFESKETGNFSLLPGSPAINSGTSQLAPAVDIEGTPRPHGGQIDRGAYEYTGTTTPPPPTGNLIENGEFDNGLTGWTTSVNSGASAVASVTTSGGLSGANAFLFTISNGGTSNWHVQLNKMALGADASKTYTLTFQAKAASSRNITVVLEQNGGAYTKYMERAYALTTAAQTFTYTFVPTATDPTANLKFFFGGSAADVWIDAIVLTAEDNTPPAVNLIENGEFDNGLTAWQTSVNSGAAGSAAVVTGAGLSGTNAARYTITAGGSSNWNVQLYQLAVGADATQSYTLNFIARAESNRNITVVLEQNGGSYTKYMERSFSLTTATQSFTHTFTPSATDPTANLKFFFGGSAADVWIDAVSLTTGTQEVYNPGLQASYWNNTTLTGSAVLERTDNQVNFDWGSGSPGSQVNADNFSSRWTGYLRPAYSETYTFSIQHNDGIRVWFNDNQVIDNWVPGQTTTSFSVAVNANEYYPLVIEHFEGVGSARAILSWQSASQSSGVVPSSALFHLDEGNLLGAATLMTAEATTDVTAFAVYPNPTDGMINMTLPEGDWDQGAVRIVDQYGKPVKSFRLDAFNREAGLFIQTSDLLPGVYVIELTGKSGHHLSRFIKR